MTVTHVYAHKFKWQGLLTAAYVVTLAACLSLAGCSGGSNNDKIRIGSGQSGTGSTDAVDYPIFYVKRTTPDMTKADDDMRHVRIYLNNADLYMRDRASISATERNITARVRSSSSEMWDVKDVDVSADGSKVIFAMRGPIAANQDEKDPPNWGIWEYVIASDDLHQVIVQDDLAGTVGQYVSPHYLPDGHILFASTRQMQSKAILLDEGKPQFEAQNESRNRTDGSAFLLHVMDGGGNGIQQVSFNQSHDLSPTVLSDGRIMFSRWDNASGRTGGGGIHLYTMNPDGTDTQLLYGSASHNTVADVNPTTNATTYPSVQFTQAHEMSDGNVLVLVRPFRGTEYGGDLYIVNTKDYVENTQAAAAGSGLAGPAQTKATPNNVRMLSGPSEGGRFVSAVPLWDGTNRILVSWSQCRVLDASNGNAIVPCTDSRLADSSTQAAPPIYSVWMYTPSDQTLQPVVVPTEGVMISDVVVAQPRTAPTYKPVNLSGDVNVDSTLGGQGVGILDIRSVYDFDGAVSGGITSIAAVSDPTNAAYTNRRARFLRIEKAVSLPDRDTRDIDNSAFGATNFMREILGYIPVEPDGSVKAKIPANVAFQISVVDSNGRRVSNFPRHNAWLTLRPGETVQCNGCHVPTRTPTSTATTPVSCPSGSTVSGNTCLVSHGRSGSFASAYAGASNAGTVFSNTNSSFAAVNVADTMAEARAVWSCANEQCASITPSVNVAYADVWPALPGSWDSAPSGCTTISAAAYSRTDSTCRTGDSKLVYTGGSGVPKLPTASACLTAWSNTCRITINYLEHIQPIWDLARVVTDGTGAVIADHTCTTCHSPTDAATAAQVPAGQLDLTNSASTDANAGVRVTSYQKLLFTHNQQQLNGAALEDICLVQAVDPVTGLVTGCATFATVSPPLLARNAAGSRFFNEFAAGGTHTTGGVSWLTSGELRLISEWVDIGAQYYNDPFKAPVN